MVSALSVATLIHRYPYAEDALAWHGFDLSELDPDVTIDELCAQPGVDAPRLLRDLDEVVELYDEDYEPWPVSPEVDLRYMA